MGIRNYDVDCELLYLVTSLPIQQQMKLSAVEADSGTHQTLVLFKNLETFLKNVFLSVITFNFNRPTDLKELGPSLLSGTCIFSVRMHCIIEYLHLTVKDSRVQLP